MDSQQKLESVRASLGVRPPHCSGTCSIPSDKLKLYYDVDDENAGKIDLARATPADLEKLARACQPATFGRNQEDVLDETYRKALKLDASAFSTLFNAESAGLADVIRRELLEGKNDKRDIRLEMYKLNIYGKDSFFKPHKDTPRGEKMFGSLVIVFPTSHEGGEFVLRHEGREWTIDFAEMLSQPSESSDPRFGYVSFFSDIEHEVLLVKSGHRVTLTYNLYFAETQSPVSVDAAPAPYEQVITEALGSLVADPALLPKGGYFGFGLRHQYPVSESTDLACLQTCLKGSDGALSRSLSSLSLNWRLCVLYRDVGIWPKQHYLNTRVIDFSQHHQVEEEDIERLMGEGVERVRFVDMSGTPIKAPERRWWSEGDEDEDEGAKDIFQVTKMPSVFGLRSIYIAYGNEVEMAHLYGDLCLVAEIPAKTA
ncbi:hypothetical protein HYDPIDRAFT_92692 [Hydnomerulius pinastri MD-312]|uniref:Fe2OG dioxygenase domain-containing protein n=1 Tax=Hydnomerulius pinastri MD-312 TaxID=994086 RepID=A0A0C9WDW7_9AGAM|nr:hypothetical protein HYDPIDRAFT_92692 [Hydnomerulius pinastri MD-312]